LPSGFRKIVEGAHNPFPYHFGAPRRRRPRISARSPVGGLAPTKSPVVCLIIIRGGFAVRASQLKGNQRWWTSNARVSRAQLKKIFRRDDAAR